MSGNYYRAHIYIREIKVITLSRTNLGKLKAELRKFYNNTDVRIECHKMYYGELVMFGKNILFNVRNNKLIEVK